MKLLGGLAAAWAVSVVLVWLATGRAVTAIVFALATALIGGLLLIMSGRRSGEAVPIEPAGADWSVTLAALDRAKGAIAITDRANRLVCANAAYGEWFDPARAPGGLDLPADNVESLARLQRTAWRDGEARVALPGSQRHYDVTVSRAGRGQDHLVWWFEPVGRDDLVQQLTLALPGALGAALGEGGIASALVDELGNIQAASPALAARAMGDATATMAGQDFAQCFRTDDRDRIYFAREGQRGTPQTLVRVPVAQGDDAGTLYWMLVVDGGVGIGGGHTAESGAAPQLEQLLEMLPLGLAMTDRDGRFLFANPAFRRAARIGDKRLPPYPSDLVVREDKPALADAVRRFGHGPATNADIPVRLRDAPDEPVGLGLAGVRGLGEAAVLLSLADSTEETKLRRQVAQATKMQAVGQLAGGVAHDFNNVLTAIIGYCDLMLLRHTPGDSDYDDIQQIKANSNRAASLTRQLLAFSRQQTLRPEVLQLPDVVSEVSQLLKRLMGEKVALRVHHDRDLGPVRADPGQLEQVIVNLAVNARDAIHDSGEAGRLTLATRKVTAAQVREMKAAILPVADYTALVIEDTGGGIPADVLPKIFEPFFSTKPTGKGTGLGLSTVYGIVKQSGGFIFASNVGPAQDRPAGARFTVYLPVHHGEVAARVAPPTETATSDFSSGGRILLVEDEDMVRAVAERALTRSGYDVVGCADGEAALDAIGQAADFDLLLTDVVMPGMDGPALAREIRSSHPDLPILFMSGYAEEQLRAEIDIADMHFIAKPFSVAAIAEKVGQVLRQARSTAA